VVYLNIYNVVLFVFVYCVDKDLVRAVARLVKSVFSQFLRIPKSHLHSDKQYFILNYIIFLITDVLKFIVVLAERLGLS
jgi:hypothetical protein